jgi:hypothetical protein
MKSDLVEQGRINKISNRLELGKQLLWLELILAN